MILSQREYIDKIARRTAENKELLELSLRQRRNQIVDLPGVEFSRVGDPDTTSTFFVELSTDMIYIERFEFKVVIEDSRSNAFRILVDGVDISPYLMAQYGGNWITGDGTFPSTQPNQNYDIIRVASDLYLEGRGDLGNALVRPGRKSITISGNGTFTPTISTWRKYSHMNR